MSIFNKKSKQPEGKMYSYTKTAVTISTDSGSMTTRIETGNNVLKDRIDRSISFEVENAKKWSLDKDDIESVYEWDDPYNDKISYARIVYTNMFAHLATIVTWRIKEDT